MDYIEPNSLVKFRGMVQDMLDPEFYLGKYYTINRKTNEKVTSLLFFFLRYLYYWSLCKCALMLSTPGNLFFALTIDLLCSNLKFDYSSVNSQGLKIRTEN